MKKNYSLWIFLVLLASVTTGWGQTYSLKDMTSEQFASGGTDEWSFERHDISAGTYSVFTTYGDSSLAVNFYDQYLTERFCLYPIMNRPASGTQYEVKRNARFSDKNEYLYVAAEYPSGTMVGGNLSYGSNYPDSLSGYEVYSIWTGKNSAITFTVPTDGYYRADMKVVRQDLWNSIGEMKVYQFFRYSGAGTAYSMGKEFSYGKTQGIDTWAAGNEAIYNENLAKIPESPSVNGNNGKPFRGLPTYSTSDYFYFYAKAGDKISFEADARSTGNSESGPRGAYARTKWTNLAVTVTDEVTAKSIPSKFVNPYYNDPVLLDSLYSVLDVAEDIINNHPEYSQASRDALEAIYITISQRVDAGAVLSMEIPTLIEQLNRAIEICRSSEGGLKVRYIFNNVTGNVVPDVSGEGNDGTLLNNASVITLGKYKAMDLGTANGYLDMGANIGSVVSGMNDYTISTYYRIDPNAPFSGNGFMLFAFSTLQASSAGAGEYIFYRMPNQSLSISAAGWNNAKSLTVNTAPVKGAWQHLVIRQKDTLCTIYINGAAVLSGKMPKPAEKYTMTTPYNWIARPPFNGDNYLKQTFVYDFRLYNIAMHQDSITAWAGLVSDLEHETNYSTNGDYHVLDSLITAYTAIVNAAPIGEAAGQYPQSVVDAFNNAIAAAQAISTAHESSQLKIDAEVALLKAAYQTFLASVIAETNTLPEGKYYITLTDSLYLTNPGTTLLANGTALTIANGGLSNTKITSDSTQIFTLTKVTSLDPPRYSIFSASNESGIYRHLTENSVFQSTWTNPGGGTTSSDDNWRTFNIKYNGTYYAVGCAGAAVTSGKKGYWYFDAANKKLAVSASGSNAVYAFKFVPLIPDALQSSVISDVKIYALNKSILISTKERSIVTVYSVTGTKMNECIVSDKGIINIKPGLYIVKVQGKTTTVKKVIVW
jgi:hypothetical protein